MACCEAVREEHSSGRTELPSRGVTVTARLFYARNMSELPFLSKFSTLDGHPNG